MGYDSAERELPEFVARLRSTPRGQPRADLIASGERLGKWVVPTLVAMFAHADQGERAALWNVLTRMVLSAHAAKERFVAGQLSSSDLALGANELGVRELLTLFRATFETTAQGATRCRAKCAERLLELKDERRKAGPVFLELDVAAWLGVWWDGLLERNDHAGLWELVPVWLCGAVEQGPLMLADALMRAPEDDRWYRLLLAIEHCTDEVQRAGRARPEFFAWLEAKTLAQLAESPGYVRNPALVAALGGSTALAQHAKDVISTRGRFWTACAINHLLFTPELREHILTIVAAELNREFPGDVHAVLPAVVPRANDELYGAIRAFFRDDPHQVLALEAYRSRR